MSGSPIPFLPLASLKVGYQKLIYKPQLLINGLTRCRGLQCNIVGLPLGGVLNKVVHHLCGVTFALMLCWYAHLMNTDDIPCFKQ